MIKAGNLDCTALEIPHHLSSFGGYGPDDILGTFNLIDQGRLPLKVGESGIYFGEVLVVVTSASTDELPRIVMIRIEQRIFPGAK